MHWKAIVVAVIVLIMALALVLAKGAEDDDVAEGLISGGAVLGLCVSSLLYLFCAGG